jgi:hypothetical protein
MEYQGKLYGKVGNKYVPLTKTSDDFDKLEEVASTYLERLHVANSDLRGTKASIVHELELAGVTETYDGEEIHSGNYLQGIRILRDRANSVSNTEPTRREPETHTNHKP